MPERPTPQLVATCLLIWIYHEKLSELQHFREANPFVQGDQDVDGGNLDESLLSSEELDALSAAIETLILGLNNSQSFHQRSTVHLDASLSSIMRVLKSSFSGISRIESSSFGQQKSDLIHLERLLLIFMDHLRSLCDSIDSLVDFFSHMSAMVATAPSDDHMQPSAKVWLDRASLHGIFVRKTTVGFNLLSFQCIARLWRSLTIYVNQWQGLEDEEDESSSSTKIINLSTLSIWPPSSQQVERYVYDKCSNMDLLTGPDDALFELRELPLLEEHYPEVPAVHYCQFLYALRRSDRITAYDALFRYFDYAMIRERRAGELQYSRPGSNPPLSPFTSISHHASVELAAVHWHFGRRSLSLQATQEGIRVAQQYNDSSCVAYALEWLAATKLGAASNNERSYSASRGGVSETQELIQRCIARATPQHLRSLAPFIMLAAAVGEMTRLDVGHGNIPMRGLKNIWNALKAAGSPSESGGVSLAMDRNMSSKAISMNAECRLKDLLSLLAKERMVESSIWKMFEQPQMSSLINETVHSIHYDVLSDRERMVLDLERATSVEIDMSKPPQTESFRTTQNDFTGSKEEAQSSSVVHEVQNASTKGEVCCDISVTARQISLFQCRQLLEFSCDFHRARALTAMLNSVSSLLSSSHKTTNLQSNVILQADFVCGAMPSMCQAGRFEESMDACQHVVSVASSMLVAPLRMKGLLRKCEILLQAQSMNICIAQVIPPLLESLSLARLLCMDAFCAMALRLLAKVFLNLGDPRKARILLRGCMSQSMASMPKVAQIEGCILMAKSCIDESEKLFDGHSMGRRKSSALNKKQRLQVKLLTYALSELTQGMNVAKEVKSVKDMKEISYLEARVCHSLWKISDDKRHLQRRKEASKLFRSMCVAQVKSYSAPAPMNRLLL